MQIYSLDDLTLTGSVQPLSSVPQLCKWWQINAVSLTGTARIGDAGITSSRGATLTSGSGQFAPPIAAESEVYDLSTVNILGTGTVSILYAI